LIKFDKIMRFGRRLFRLCGLQVHNMELSACWVEVIHRPVINAE
jgi:hypothetical protein